MESIPCAQARSARAGPGPAEFWVAPPTETSQSLWVMLPAFDHPHSKNFFYKDI